MNLSPGILAALTLLPLVYQTDQSRPPGPGRRYTSVQRMDLERLRALNEECARIQAVRRPVLLRTGLEDFRAILHAHAEDSAHTGGTRSELLAAAKRAGVNVIFLTDHIRPERDFIDDSWRGLREGVLFVPGSEGEGFLNFPVASVRAKPWKSRGEWIDLIREGGGNIFLSHVEEKTDWDTRALDGLEIYNHHSDVKDEAEFSAWLRSSLTGPALLAQIQRALELYPQEVMAAQQDYLADIIQKWDRDTRDHRLTGVAANDCHHNQGFRITVADARSIQVEYISDKKTQRRITVDQAPGIAVWLSDRRPGETIADLDFDPYERSLRYVSTHLLMRSLTEEEARKALRSGHAYVSHDWMCDPTGFAVVAEGIGQKGTMGDEVKLTPDMKLRVEAPAAGIIKVLRDGVILQVNRDRTAQLEVKEPGVYRVEVWLEVDGEQRPWIYANPVYVRGDAP